MIFKYKPKVEEVNENLPDWVAAGLEGQLEWEMEIWAECDEGIVMPHALFYPGKVEWDEDNETYDIVGRGEGRRFDLNPVTYMTMTTYANAAIGVSIDKTVDPFINPIEALTKRQRFNVMVRLPAEMADEVGKKIEVTLKGLKNGNKDTVELKAGRRSGNNPVLYKHKGNLTIADKTDSREDPRKQKPLSFNYMFGNAGDRLDLDVENEEIVQISYKDLKFEVPIYESFYQSGNARFKKAADRLRSVYSMFLGENFTMEQRQAAHTKMRMLLNYEKILTSEYVTDRHRYNLGELYFGNGTPNSIGLLQLPQKSVEASYIDPEEYTLHKEDDPINPLMKAALEGMTGKDMSIKSPKAADQIVWTSKAEEQQVEKALYRTSIDARKEIMEVIYKDLSFGMYQGITSTTGTDSVYLVATGTDTFGRKVPTWQRVQSAIGLGSGAILSVTGANVVKNFATKPQLKRISNPYSSSKALKSSKKGTAEISKNIDTPQMPKTLKQKQKNQTSTEVIDNDADGNFIDDDMSGGYVIPDEFKAVRTVEEGIERMFNHSPLSPHNKKMTKANIQREGKRYVKNKYPKSAKIIKDEVEEMDVQSYLPNLSGKNIKSYC